MDGSRFWRLAILSLALALASNQTGWTQTAKPYPPWQSNLHAPSSLPSSSKMTCKVYSLADFAGDPEFCQWIADTLPQVIQPGNWNSTVQYNPKVRMMVVSQTPMAHAQIEEYLENLKKTLVQQGKKATAKTGPLPQQEIMQAHFSKVEGQKAASAPPANKAPGYPVPAPLTQPKHLFHFIIRYEGDGVMDAAMTEVAKKLGHESPAKEEKETKEEKSKPESAKPETDNPVQYYKPSFYAKADSSDGSSVKDKPAQLNQLLHFIIRYEGDGIVDSNVVELVKVFQSYQLLQEKANSALNPPSAPVYSYTPAATGTPTAQPIPPTPVAPAATGNSNPPVQPTTFLTPMPASSRAATPSGSAVNNQPRMPLADESTSKLPCLPAIPR